MVFLLVVAISVEVSAFILQLPAFHASVVVPSQDTDFTSPSALEPSPLQTFIGFVRTIQFHHCMKGESPIGGTFQARLAGPPIQIAVPIPRVNVGVTKTLKKLLGEKVHRYHQAPGRFALHVVSRLIGLIGHTAGTAIQPHGQYNGIPVIALKVGIHSETLNPSPTGNQKRTGSFPGASGAQFIGDDIQEPPPNPQESPSAIF